MIKRQKTIKKKAWKDKSKYVVHREAEETEEP